MLGKGPGHGKDKLGLEEVEGGCFFRADEVISGTGKDAQEEGVGGRAQGEEGGHACRAEGPACAMKVGQEVTFNVLAASARDMCWLDLVPDRGYWEAARGWEMVKSTARSLPLSQC